MLAKILFIAAIALVGCKKSSNDSDDATQIENTAPTPDSLTENLGTPTVDFSLSESQEIQQDTPLVLNFSEEMDPASLVISGDFGSATFTTTWTSDQFPNDTLTLVSSNWGIGTGRELILSIETPDQRAIEEIRITLLVRNNIFGNGSDGDLALSASIDTDDTTQLGRTFSASRRVTSQSGTTLNLHAAITDDDFRVGDEVFWHVTAAGTTSSCVSHRGKYGFVEVTSVAGSSITVSEELTIGAPDSLPFSDTNFCLVQVYRVPQFKSLHLESGNLSAFPFNDTKGGIIVLKVQETLRLTGSLNAGSLGFNGGAAGENDGQGFGGLGEMQGGGPARSGIVYAGGGGNRGHGSNGQGGGPGNWGYRAQECGGGLCDASERLFLGGGGGSSSDERGGNGGGLILVYAKNVVNLGNLGPRFIAFGEGTSGDGTNGAGAGAGGTIYLVLDTPGLSSDPTLWLRADGGSADEDAAEESGAGGGGYIQIDHCSNKASNTNLDLDVQEGNGNFDGAASYTGETSENTTAATCSD